MFGAEPPHFNVEGRQKITTLVGLILTITAMTTILSYGMHKLLHLKQGKYTIIVNEETYDVHLTPEDSIHLSEFNFMIAFSAHNAVDRTIKYDDLSKIDWFV
jgi:hypothetical protein